MQRALAGLLPAWQHTQAMHPAIAAQGTVTAADFVQRVAALSAAISHRPETRWLVWLPELSDFAVALFAVWHAGRTPVLPPSFQPQMLDELSAAYDGVLTTTPCDKPHLLCAPQSGAVAALPPLPPLGAQTQLVLYTSGSTDQPKAVVKSLAQLQSEIEVLEQLWGSACNDRPVLATVPHHHIYGLLFRVLWPLAAQRLIVAEIAATPTELSAAWQQYGQCVLVSSPAHLTRLPALVDLPEWTDRYVTVFSSGAPFPEEAAATIAAAWKNPVQEVYGSSETGGIAWRHIAQSHYPGWTPMPGVEIRQAEDETLQIVSPFLPDRTPFATADRIELLEHGCFKLCGRIDRVVKIEGKRASLEQVESWLRQHQWVDTVAIVALSEPRQCLAAVIVLNREGMLRLTEGRAALTQQFKRYMGQAMDAVLVPRRWRYVEQMPVDERGKLPLRNLLALFEVQAA